MNPRVTQKDDDLICLSHHQPIIMIRMDNSVAFQDIMLCGQCLQEKQTISNKIIGITQVKTMVNEKYQKLDEESESNKQLLLKGIEAFQQNVSKLRTEVLQYFDETLRITQFWLTELRNIGQKPPSFDLINQILQLYNNDHYQQKTDNQLEDVNKSHSIKLDQVFKKLLVVDDYKNCYDQLNNLQINTFDMNRKKTDLLYQVRRIYMCNGLQYIDGSILVAGSKNDIKIWKFDKGQLSELKRLKGQSEDVNCLAFSRKMNWFALGSDDNTIRCWQEQENSDWLSSEPQQENKYRFYQLILNKNEDQLISCCIDGTIKVWKVNCQANQLTFDYTLEEKRHKYTVYSISLNESETSLISCSKDKQIILWAKGKDQRWTYQNHMTKDDFGRRICFINDIEIMWQQNSQGFTHILEIENGQLKDKPEFKIPMGNATDDYSLNPTIFNKKHQITIQNHNQHYYILRKQRDGKWKVVGEPITGSCGTLTEDGQYLVIRKIDTKELGVYLISCG